MTGPYDYVVFCGNIVGFLNFRLLLFFLIRVSNEGRDASRRSKCCASEQGKLQQFLVLHQGPFGILPTLQNGRSRLSSL